MFPRPAEVTAAGPGLQRAAPAGRLALSGYLPAVLVEKSSTRREKVEPPRRPVSDLCCRCAVCLGSRGRSRDGGAQGAGRGLPTWPIDLSEGRRTGAAPHRSN